MGTVEAQPLRAPRSGLALLVAAPTVTGGDETWFDGFRWQPEVAADGASLGIACGGSTADRDPENSQPGTESFDPFLVWASEQCSTKGWRGRDWLGRAVRSLEAQRSYLVAREFWSGSIEESNAHLASSTAATITGGPVSLTAGLTMIDSRLTRVLMNRQGMVHVRPEVHVGWVDRGLLRYDSGGWLTPLGHQVVADAGYTGDGPRPDEGDDPIEADGSSQWIYGTDLVYSRLGPMDTLPESIENEAFAEAVIRPENNIAVFAQQVVGLQWDREAHIAVEVAQGALA